MRPNQSLNCEVATVQKMKQNVAPLPVPTRYITPLPLYCICFCTLKVIVP